MLHLAARLSLLDRIKAMLTATIAVTLSASSFAVDFGSLPSPGTQMDVVALARNPSEGEGPFKIYCSGVVIHPKVVLTAAHCLQESATRPSAKDLKRFVKTLRIHVGEGHSSGFVNQNLISVDRAEIHPSYMRGIRGWFDLGILILKKPAPVPVDQIRPLALEIDTLRNDLMPNRTLIVSGFGYSENVDDGKDSFGLKRQGEIRIEGKTANEILIVGGSPLPGTDKFSSPRDGDSGGPVFYREKNGRESLAGIVSRATKHNTGAYGSALSLVRPSVCWIEREAGIRLRASSEIDYCKMKAPIPDPDQNYEMNFQHLCMNSRSLPLSAQYTLSVLQKKLKETDCGRLEKKITVLTNLNLDATFITDISPLASFSNLKRLSIRDNGVESISPLKALPRLTYLDLSYNNIKDLHTFEKLESRGLRIVGRDRQKTNITRTEFLKLCLNDKAPASTRATITSILRLFELKENQCINANYELVRLRSLDFYQTEGLTDMSPLVGLSTLESLDLTGQKMRNLEFLRSLKGLKTLILDGNAATDLRPVLNLPYLRELSIQNMGLQDISLLSRLPRLKKLNVTGNQIKDFSLLKEQERRGLQVMGKESQ